MPRDGSGIYSYPPGTEGVPDTTIESAKYNGYIADVRTDLNLPRPIIAGGTGATSATAARVALDAAVAMATVTNYDSHPWETGSFWSALGTTAAPTAGTYSGTAVVPNHDPNYVTLVARAANSGPTYTREKYAGTWGAWARADQASIDLTNTKVNRAGDTMSGALTINAGLSVNGAVSVQRSDIPANGLIYFGAANTAYIHWDNSAFVLNGGPVGLTAEGTAGNHAVTKNYIDGGLSNRVLKAGDTMTGPLNVVGIGAFAGINMGSATTGGPGYLYWSGDPGIRINYNDAANEFYVGRSINTAGIVTMTGFHCPSLVGFGLGSIAFSGAANWGLAIHNTNTQNGAAFANFGAGGTATIGAITNNNNTGVLYATTSDARLKEDYRPIDTGIIDRLAVHDFKWRDRDARGHGVIAQEAVEVYPQAVAPPDGTRDVWMLDYSRFVPLLLAAVQELRAEVAALKAGRS